MFLSQEMPFQGRQHDGLRHLFRGNGLRQNSFVYGRRVKSVKCYDEKNGELLRVQTDTHRYTDTDTDKGTDTVKKCDGRLGWLGMGTRRRSVETVAAAHESISALSRHPSHTL